MLDVLALRHAMLDAGCTAKELAKECKISPAALSRRLSGEVQFNLGEISACVSRLQLTPEKRDKIFFAQEVA